MQTFLPVADFKESAKILDYRRLGKQRVEARQILNALQGKSKGWANHPATKMWKGFESALEQYLRETILEWKSRGYKNNMEIPEQNNLTKNDLPKWFGDENFHAAHRSNLLRKKFDYYSKFGWKENSDLQYIWPVD